MREYRCKFGLSVENNLTTFADRHILVDCSRNIITLLDDSSTALQFLQPSFTKIESSDSTFFKLKPLVIGTKETPLVSSKTFLFLVFVCGSGSSDDSELDDEDDDVLRFLVFLVFFGLFIGFFFLGDTLIDFATLRDGLKESS